VHQKSASEKLNQIRGLIFTYIKAALPVILYGSRNPLAEKGRGKFPKLLINAKGRRPRMMVCAPIEDIIINNDTLTCYWANSAHKIIALKVTGCFSCRGLFPWHH
jgi:hypothetical protein